MSESKKANLPKVMEAFSIYGTFVSGESYGSGHINDTFCATVDQAGTNVRYIFQRINDRIFKDVPALMENIDRVTAHASRANPEKTSRGSLTLVPSRKGASFERDETGSYWRCYLFIEGARTYDMIESPRQAYEAARAFGRFQRLLSNMPGPRLHETIPRFHDTPSRFAALEKAIATDSHRRVAEAASEIDFAVKRRSITGVLLDLVENGSIPERVTHNDTKVNNVMIDDVTGEGICVIDLDTVMPGLALYDFGDLVRSATNSAREDETDLSKVSMRMGYYEHLLEGYLAGAGSVLNEAEIQHLAFSGKLITFEIGMRFLTDYLEGDRYFKTHRPGQNLDRARNQFALVRSIELQETEMQKRADRIAARR